MSRVARSHLTHLNCTLLWIEAKDDPFMPYSILACLFIGGQVPDKGERLKTFLRLHFFLCIKTCGFKGTRADDDDPPIIST